MVLPVNKPSTVDVAWATVNTVSSTSLTATRAPYAGRVIKVGATLAGTTATADATCTTNINGTAITGGQFVITNGSNNTTVSVIPSGANIVNEDDSIGFVFSGTGTAGGFVTCFAEVRSGTL
jgi:hypothetical protein